MSNYKLSVNIVSMIQVESERDSELLSSKSVYHGVYHIMIYV